MTNATTCMAAVHWRQPSCLGTGACPAQEVLSLRGEVPIDEESAAPDTPRQNTAGRFARAYRQQPPLVPHRIAGYEIDLKVNKCLSCHDWPNSVEQGATKVSETHYVSRDGVALDRVAGTRWFCTSVPRAAGERPGSWSTTPSRTPKRSDNAAPLATGSGAPPAAGPWAFSSSWAFSAASPFGAAFNWSMEMTNNEPFCISCHEMRDTVYQEYREHGALLQSLGRARILPRLPCAKGMGAQGGAQGQGDQRTLPQVHHWLDQTRRKSSRPSASSWPRMSGTR